MDFKVQVGQRLVGGFPGKEMSPEFIRLVREYKLGNVILFQHNVESMEQLRQLCREIQGLIRKETGHSAFITIDQEGGVVTRLPGDGCNVPGAMAVAATGQPENARTLAKITANELKYLGVSFNLAPVMDINNNPQNPVIGVRSYGDTAETVTRFGVETVKGYQEGNMLACAKHFPGHGDTNVDSHLGLPVIDKSLEELEELELKPFRAAIENGIPAVMSSHILFPKLEPEQVPCTMSKRIITGILKEKLGFQGLVLSDCMEMDAIQKYYGTAKGVAAAMEAGVDMVFVSHSADLLEESFQEVYKAVEEGRLSKEEMEKTAAKIQTYKEKYLSKWQTEQGCSEEERQQEREIRRKSITLTQGEIFSLGEAPFFTGCAGYRATQVSNEKQMSEAFAEYLAKRLGGKAFVTSKNPNSEERKKALLLAKGASSIVVGTYNGHLQPEQKELIKELERLGCPVMAIALRNPYDLFDLPERVTGIAAWDNSPMTLELLSEMLRGEWTPEGILPIRNSVEQVH